MAWRERKLTRLRLLGPAVSPPDPEARRRFAYRDLQSWNLNHSRNLHLMRPERSEYLLSYCFFLRRQLFPPRFVHGRFTHFVAISLRRSW
jgi:hypothetical protein